MPELPEVETARRSLERTVVGKGIASVDVRSPASVRTHQPAAFVRTLKGLKIEDVTRRGKTLLFRLSRGWTLVFHFKLWGLIRFSPAGSTADDRAAVVIGFRDGSAMEFRELQLSEIGLHQTDALDRVEYLATLGIEPLSPACTDRRFRELLQGRGAVRSLLTDQERIAGIGNLWAHEILHEARIRPDREAQSLAKEEITRLYQSVKRVLREAIRAGGEPEFVDAAGRTGRWRLRVYGRGGQPCPRSDGTVKATRLGGRPSFYCPACQR